MRTTSQSDSTARAAGDAQRSPPAFADHRRAISPVIGAFIDRGDAFDHFAVGRDHVAGFDQHDVALAQVVAASTS